MSRIGGRFPEARSICGCAARASSIAAKPVLAERFADALRDEPVKLHAARHFNDAPEHVSRYAVLPCGAGLVGERKPAELANHLGICLFFVGDACALIA